MNQRTKGFNLAILFPIVILCYTFSLLWGWIPRTHSIITLIVGLASVIIICYKYFSNRPAFFLLLFVMVLLLNTMAGDHRYHSVSVVFYETVFMLIPAMMAYGLLNYPRNEGVANMTVALVLWMIIINAIGSTFVESLFPGSIRALNAETKITGDSSLQTYYYRYGVTNYFLPHALPMIIPVLLMGARNINLGKRKQFLILAALLSCLIISFLSGSTTVLLLSVFALIVSFITRNKANKSRIITLAIVGILLAFLLGNDNVMLSILQWFDGLIGGESYFHSKVVDFEHLILYNETTGDIAEREDLYMTTINAIISNPVFGVNHEIGGHSVILDHWGDLGLVGFLPFVLFIISQIKMSSNNLPGGALLFYYEGVYIALMMLSIKAINGWEMWLFLFAILPLLTRYCNTARRQSHT